MANKIKRGNYNFPESFNIKDWTLGLSNGMGPSASTGFKNGMDIPNGGYVIYSDASRVRVAANEDELMEIINSFGASVYTMGDAVLWARSNNVLILNKVIKNIATDGLVTYLDANHVYSFPENKRVVNLLEQSGASTLSTRTDIYRNVSKWDLGNGKYRFDNDGTGSTTVRLYTKQSDLIDGETYTASISYEDYQQRTGTLLRPIYINS